MGYNDRLTALEEMVAQMKDVIEGLAKCDVPWECETREARKERIEKERDARCIKHDYQPGRPDGWDGFRRKDDGYEDRYGHPLR